MNKLRNIRNKKIVFSFTLILLIVSFNLVKLSSNVRENEVKKNELLLNIIGNGTEENPFEIRNAKQLFDFAQKINNKEMYNDIYYYNSYYVLTNDIDLSKYSEGNGWIMIGTNEEGFTGVFDGNYHKIKGLKIDSDFDEVGFFSKVKKGGTVRRIGIEDCDINAKYNDTNNSGGLIGILENGMVKECYVTGKIIGIQSGGIVGEANYSNIEDCWVDLFGHSMGGIAGTVYKTIVDSCYTTGYISPNSIVAYSSYSTITNCVALNIVENSSSFLGTEHETMFSDNYLLNGIHQGCSYNEKCADEIKYINGKLYPQPWIYWSNDIWGISSYDKLPVLVGFEDEQRDIPSYITNIYEDLDKDINGNYMIKTSEDLMLMRDRINSGDKEYIKASYVLENDLDLSSYMGEQYFYIDWEPIAYNRDEYDVSVKFEGIFDGKNHTISGFDLDSSSVVGMFSVIGKNGIVRNLNIKDSSISAKNFVGAIAGEVRGGTIDNCNIENVTINGIAGYVLDGNIVNCTVNANIESVYYSGGVVGILEKSTLKNCYMNGNIKGESDFGEIFGKQIESIIE